MRGQLLRHLCRGGDRHRCPRSRPHCLRVCQTMSSRCTMRPLHGQITPPTTGSQSPAPHTSPQTPPSQQRRQSDPQDPCLTSSRQPRTSWTNQTKTPSTRHLSFRPLHGHVLTPGQGRVLKKRPKPCRVSLWQGETLGTRRPACWCPPMTLFPPPTTRAYSPRGHPPQVFPPATDTARRAHRFTSSAWTNLRLSPPQPSRLRSLEFRPTTTMA